MAKRGGGGGGENQGSLILEDVEATRQKDTV